MGHALKCQLRDLFTMVIWPLSTRLINFSCFASSPTQQHSFSYWNHTVDFVDFNKSFLGPFSRKSRKLFGPEKPFVNLRLAYSVKLVFSYVVKGRDTKITAKFRASRRLRCEDTKRIKSSEIRLKSFGTFEKRGPVSRKSRERFGPEKPVAKLQSACFEKLIF